MRIVNNRIFVMAMVMVMIASIGTTSFGEDLNLEVLIAEETETEETPEPEFGENPLIDEAQEDQEPFEDEGSNIAEDIVDQDLEAEIVIEEIIDEIEEELEGETDLGENPAEESDVSDEPEGDQPAIEEMVEEEIAEEVVEDQVKDEISLEEDVLEEEATEEEEVIEEIDTELPLTEEEEIIIPLETQPEIIEPVFEEQIIPRYISLHIVVEPSSETYTNGDRVEYDIIIENNGTDTMENLDIRDDLGVDETIGHLESGERAIITGSYEIDNYNRLETLGNAVRITAICDGEKVGGEVGFVVHVEVPLGSISISKSVEGRVERNQTFTVLVEGPNNYLNYVQLGASDTVTLRNLFIGIYRISPIDSMNLSLSDYESTVSITTSNLDREVSIDYRLEKAGWFSDWDYHSVEVMRVDSEDTDVSKIELRSNGLDRRSDEMFLDLEPLIVLVEVQVEALQQPEGEDSSSVADPVQDVTSDPVEAVLQEEVTQPDAPEEPVELEPAPLTKPETDQVDNPDTQEEIENPTTDSVDGDKNEIVQEPEALEDSNNNNSQIVMEEPEAVIPDDPVEKPTEDKDTGNVGDGTEEPDVPDEQEDLVVPSDPEEIVSD